MEFQIRHHLFLMPLTTDGSLAAGVGNLATYTRISTLPRFFPDGIRLYGFAISGNYANGLGIDLPASPPLLSFGIMKIGSDSEFLFPALNDSELVFNNSVFSVKHYQNFPFNDRIISDSYYMKFNNIENIRMRFSFLGMDDVTGLVAGANTGYRRIDVSLFYQDELAARKEEIWKSVVTRSGNGLITQSLS